MKIAVITPDYPNAAREATYVFTQNIAWSLRDLGHEVIVICPLNVLHRENKAVPEVVTEETLNGNPVKIYFPKFVSPWMSYKSPIDLIGIRGKHEFRKKTERILDECHFCPDVLYAQFLDPAGVCISKLKDKYGAKAVASFGESSFWSISPYFRARTVATLNRLDGIDAVSTENKRRLLAFGIQDERTIGVFPNGIDTRRYHQLDKAACRKRFGFRQDAFIVAFVGGFIDRKGILRVEAAAKNLPGVSVAYAGRGPQQPTAANTIHAAPVRPDHIAEFLSAADIFVLPTLNEGCCNAVIEAMACGLPVISSDLPFHDDILNKDNSIRVDPLDASAIQAAIASLAADERKRASMHTAALATAAGLDIIQRAKKLADFFEQLGRD